jgi:hypothetical protein
LFLTKSKYPYHTGTNKNDKISDKKNLQLGEEFSSSNNTDTEENSGDISRDNEDSTSSEVIPEDKDIHDSDEKVGKSEKIENESNTFSS